MTIDEDFAFLSRWLDERGGERAKAALSRIEAEFERLCATLQDEVERLRAQNLRLEDENNRLAEGRDMRVRSLEASLEASRDQRGVLGAEVERLRAELREKTAQFDSINWSSRNWTNSLKEAKAEVERQQAELKLWKDDFRRVRTERDEALLEVECLRAIEAAAHRVAYEPNVGIRTKVSVEQLEALRQALEEKK